MGNCGVLDKVNFIVNKSPIRGVSHPKDQVHVFLIMFCDGLSFCSSCSDTSGACL